MANSRVAIGLLSLAALAGAIALVARDPEVSERAQTAPVLPTPSEAPTPPRAPSDPAAPAANALGDQHANAPQGPSGAGPSGAGPSGPGPNGAAAVVAPSASAHANTPGQNAANPSATRARFRRPELAALTPPSTEEDAPGAAVEGRDEVNAAPVPSPEERFLENIDMAYSSAMDGLAHCASALPPELEDTIYLEMTVSDDPEVRGIGAVRVDTISSATLVGPLADCARSVLTGTAVPPPYQAHASEGAAYSIRSESAVEYTLVFEMAVDAAE